MHLMRTVYAMSILIPLIKPFYHLLEKKSIISGYCSCMKFVSLSLLLLDKLNANKPQINICMHLIRNVHVWFKYNTLVLRPPFLFTYLGYTLDTSTVSAQHLLDTGMSHHVFMFCACGCNRSSFLPPRRESCPRIGPDQDRYGNHMIPSSHAQRSSKVVFKNWIGLDRSIKNLSYDQLS